jgi:hypothetical protein
VTHVFRLADGEWLVYRHANRLEEQHMPSARLQLADRDRR